jgi:predicted CopG family antitoxin
MATKTISISEEAYSILKGRKADTESFSEAIVRLTGKKKLASFFGALSRESADALEKEIMSSRKRHRVEHTKRVLQYDL